jgi:hypothetical protein
MPGILLVIPILTVSPHSAGKKEIYQEVDNEKDYYSGSYFILHAHVAGLRRRPEWQQRSRPAAGMAK